jgi:hypothetical protein
MLTDDDLTTRLGAAFRETVPEMEYGGAVPHVRHRGAVATTSVLMATAALALASVALQQGQDRTPLAGPVLPTPHTHPSPPTGRTTTHTLDVGGLRLTYASVDGKPGMLYFVGGPHLSVPANAEKLDLQLSVDVWYVADPAQGDPDLYVQPRGGCPDTVEGCTPGYTPQLYGVLAPGWTREQLVALLEHPVEVQGAR